MKGRIAFLVLLLLFSVSGNAASKPDHTPPVIHSMYFQNSVWQAGSRQKLFLQITDDVSGVSIEKPMDLDFNPSDGTLPRPTVVEPQSAGQFKREGKNLYSLEFTVSKWLQPKAYVLQSVVVTDRAGNMSQLYLKGDNDQTYTINNNGQLSDVAVIQAEVQNTGAVDVTPPTLLDVYSSEKVWKAGSKHKIYFRISDDVSGMRAGWADYFGMYSTFKIKDHNFRMYPFRDLVDEGGGVYSAESTIPQYLPSGEYELPYMIIYDRANNMLVIESGKDGSSNYDVEAYTFPRRATSIPVFRIKIENDGLVDTEPPKILDWKVTNSVWRAGSQQRFYFRVSDDVSGFAKAYGSFTFFSGLKAPMDADSVGAYFNFDKGDVRREGNNWYSVGLKVSEYVREGDYWIGSFDISDSAGNQVSISCVYTGSCTYDDQVRTPAPQVPRTKIKVIR